MDAKIAFVARMQMCNGIGYIGLMFGMAKTRANPSGMGSFGNNRLADPILKMQLHAFVCRFKAQFFVKPNGIRTLFIGG